LWAINRLRHDEQIHAATTSGVFSTAFCIQLSDSSGVPSEEQLAYDNQRTIKVSLDQPYETPPTRPMTYVPTADNIYVVGHDCAIGCVKRPYDDDCAIHHASEIIESPYLEDQLARGSEIAICLGLRDLESTPYILDIDLDVFILKGPSNQITQRRFTDSSVTRLLLLLRPSLNVLTRNGLMTRILWMLVSCSSESWGTSKQHLADQVINKRLGSVG
jgi:hypothetical protein